MNPRKPPVDVSVARDEEGRLPTRTSDILDLHGLTLADLRALDDGAAASGLRRILRDIDRPTDAVAGFQSAI
jgi:FXSXX-COOH protein